jgi:endogenous inhibitor of DNA gyrase (YacG/DUF329 family)
MSADKKRQDGGKLVRLRPPRACPICGKPSVRGAWPFCSTRCADVDLNRWLSGQYRIPAAPDDDEAAGEEGESEAEPDDREG